MLRTQQHSVESRGVTRFGINEPWQRTFIPMGGPRAHVNSKPSIVSVMGTCNSLGVLARRTTIFVYAIQARIEMRDPGRGRSIAIELDGSHRQLVLEYLYGLTGGFSRSQCSTHFTVLTSTSAFLCPEKLMSGRMNSVCGPLATLKEQLKLIDCTPRSLHPV